MHVSSDENTENFYILGSNVKKQNVLLTYEIN